jgi:hypothetical protein
MIEGLYFLFKERKIQPLKRSIRYYLIKMEVPAQFHKKKIINCKLHTAQLENLHKV